MSQTPLAPPTLAVGPLLESMVQRATMFLYENPAWRQWEETRTCRHHSCVHTLAPFLAPLTHALREEGGFEHKKKGKGITQASGTPSPQTSTLLTVELEQPFPEEHKGMTLSDQGTWILPVAYVLECLIETSDAASEPVTLHPKSLLKKEAHAAAYTGLRQLHHALVEAGHHAWIFPVVWRPDQPQNVKEDGAPSEETRGKQREDVQKPWLLGELLLKEHFLVQTSSEHATLRVASAKTFTRALWEERDAAFLETLWFTLPTDQAFTLWCVDKIPLEYDSALWATSTHEARRELKKIIRGGWNTAVAHTKKRFLAWMQQVGTHGVSTPPDAEMPAARFERISPHAESAEELHARDIMVGWIDNLCVHLLGNKKEALTWLDTHGVGLTALFQVTGLDQKNEKTRAVEQTADILLLEMVWECAQTPAMIRLLEQAGCPPPDRLPAAQQANLIDLWHRQAPEAGRYHMTRPWWIQRAKTTPPSVTEMAGHLEDYVRYQIVTGRTLPPPWDQRTTPLPEETILKLYQTMATAWANRPRSYRIKVLQSLGDTVPAPCAGWPDVTCSAWAVWWQQHAPDHPEAHTILHACRARATASGDVSAWWTTQWEALCHDSDLVPRGMGWHALQHSAAFFEAVPDARPTSTPTGGLEAEALIVYVEQGKKLPLQLRKEHLVLSALYAHTLTACKHAPPAPEVCKKLALALWKSGELDILMEKTGQPDAAWHALWIWCLQQQRDSLEPLLRAERPSLKRKASPYRRGMEQLLLEATLLPGTPTRTHAARRQRL